MLGLRRYDREAPAPKRLIKSGIPTDGLVASVVVDQLAWHNPLTGRHMS
jgi:transposase